MGNRAQVIAADFNNDGKTDLYLSGCETLEYTGQPLECSTGIFFENLGDGKYRAHEDAGLEPTVNEAGSSAGDVNGDGLLDLYVSDALTFPAPNTQLIGKKTSRLYINKVREIDLLTISMEHPSFNREYRGLDMSSL